MWLAIIFLWLSAPSRIRASQSQTYWFTVAITGARQSEQHGSWRRPHPSGSRPEPLQDRLRLSESGQCCSRAISQLIHFISTDHLLDFYTYSIHVSPTVRTWTPQEFIYQYFTLQINSFWRIKGTIIKKVVLHITGIRLRSINIQTKLHGKAVMVTIQLAVLLR